jgi:superoxide dismutase, Cu-Zn family
LETCPQYTPDFVKKLTIGARLCEWLRSSIREESPIARIGYNPLHYLEGRSVRINLFMPGILAGLLVIAVPSSAKTKVEIKDAQGKSVGEILIWDQGSGVGLQLNLHDLTPGEQAIHFHAVPKCEGPDFKSAGGHFNPEGKKHGFDNPDGHHAGDMKNFTVGDDGKASVKLEDKDATLKEGPHSLLSNGGSAIVIHAKADDYKTDPSGNSGDRVACGVITK